MLQQRAHPELYQGGKIARWPDSSTTGYVEGERYASTPGQWRSTKTLSPPSSSARHRQQLLQESAHWHRKQGLHNRDNHEMWKQTGRSSIPVHLQRHFDPSRELKQKRYKIDCNFSTLALNDVMLLDTNSNGAQYNYQTWNVLKEWLTVLHQWRDKKYSM